MLHQLFAVNFDGDYQMRVEGVAARVEVWQFMMCSEKVVMTTCMVT